MTFDLTRLTLSQLVALVRTLDLFVHHQSCPTIIQTGHVHSAVEIQANHCPLCVLRALPARALVTSVTGEEGGRRFATLNDDSDDDDDEAQNYFAGGERRHVS
jgi:hypothetical protein